MGDAPQFVRAVDDGLPELAADPGRIVLQRAVRGEWDVSRHQVALVPFADAGAGGQPYAVGFAPPRAALPRPGWSLDGWDRAGWNAGATAAMRSLFSAHSLGTLAWPTPRVAPIR